MNYPFKSLEKENLNIIQQNDEYQKCYLVLTCYFLKFEAAEIAKNCYFVDLDSRAELLRQ